MLGTRMLTRFLIIIAVLFTPSFAWAVCTCLSYCEDATVLHNLDCDLCTDLGTTNCADFGQVCIPATDTEPAYCGDPPPSCDPGTCAATHECSDSGCGSWSVQDYACVGDVCTGLGFNACAAKQNCNSVGGCVSAETILDGVITCPSTCAPSATVSIGMQITDDNGGTHWTVTPSAGTGSFSGIPYEICDLTGGCSTSASFGYTCPATPQTVMISQNAISAVCSNYTFPSCSIQVLSTTPLLQLLGAGL